MGPAASGGQHTQRFYPVRDFTLWGPLGYTPLCIRDVTRVLLEQLSCVGPGPGSGEAVTSKVLPLTLNLAVQLPLWDIVRAGQEQT